MKNALIATLILSACATRSGPTSTPCDPGLALVNAALWVQSAAEYRASAVQTYAVARRALDAALAAEIGGATHKPPAVILDLDETSIDNICFEARMVREGKMYDGTEWKQWIAESSAAATPGAADFLAYARSRGVTPFYITNRKTDEEASTRRNLEKLGYPLDPSVDTLLARGERPEWSSSDKAPRRDYVASRYRVVLVFGDDLNDFVAAQGKTSEQRLALIRDTAEKWGTSWFILPNPMYGSWESAIAGNGTPCEQLERKIEALKP